MAKPVSSAKSADQRKTTVGLSLEVLESRDVMGNSLIGLTGLQMPTSWLRTPGLLQTQLPTRGKATVLNLNPVAPRALASLNLVPPQAAPQTAANAKLAPVVNSTFTDAAFLLSLGQLGRQSLPQVAESAAPDYAFMQNAVAQPGASAASIGFAVNVALFDNSYGAELDAFHGHSDAADPLYRPMPGAGPNLNSNLDDFFGGNEMAAQQRPAGQERPALARRYFTIGTGAPTLGNEAEPNNTAGSANNLALRDNNKFIMSGTISSSSDADFFRFTLTNRAGVFIDVDARERGLSNLDSVVTLFAADGTTQLDTNDNGYDFDTGYPSAASAATPTSGDSALYRDLDPGTYFVRVTGANNTTGAYELKVTPDTRYSSTPIGLNSNPGARDTVHLVLNGYTSIPGERWNGGRPFTTPPYDLNGNPREFTPGEQLSIANMFAVVAEDYSPFNVNISTDYTGPYGDGIASKVLIGLTGPEVSDWQQGILGLAFINSYGTGGLGDQSCLVFNAGGNIDYIDSRNGSSAEIVAWANEIGNVASHEMGHTFGLGHHSTPANSIMLAVAADADSQLRKLWANTSQDDLAVISNTTNTFGYRPDDVGNDIRNATPLPVVGRPDGTTVYEFCGVIHRLSDLDVFSFVAAGTSSTITVDVWEYVNNLDVKMRVFDSTGTEIANVNPSDSFDARVTIPTVRGRTYYVEVGSAGTYSELGEYCVEVTPAPGGGGGGTSDGSEDNRWEPNDSSDRARRIGPIGSLFNTIVVPNLAIQRKANFDRDWFRFEASRTGRINVEMLITPGGGDLDLRVYRLRGKNLIEAGRSLTRLAGAKESITFNASAKEQIFVWVYGVGGARGNYELNVKYV
jgi:hypothetical protein